MAAKDTQRYPHAQWARDIGLQQEPCSKLRRDYDTLGKIAKMSADLEDPITRKEMMPGW